MPLVKVNSFDEVGLSSSRYSKVIKADFRKQVSFPHTLSLRALSEVSFTVEPPIVSLAQSTSRWGLYLKSLSLYKSCEGFIANLFNPLNEIYFVSIAWDYSGSPPFVYPPGDAQASAYLIPIKAGTTRTFIGNGVSLWPARIVSGALNLVVLIYESRMKERELGDQLVLIHEQIANSKLSDLIKAIAGCPSLATGVAIGAAVNELLGVVGNIMKRTKDDYVDLFEGSYGTDKQQTAGVCKYNDEAVGVELEFTVSGM